jgi:hypothetical protein
MHISICLNVIYKVGSLQIIQTIILVILILIISLHITDKDRRELFAHSDL